MRIAMASIIVQGLHSSDSNRDFRQPFAPWTPESICDEHWDGKAQMFFQGAMNLRR